MPAKAPRPGAGRRIEISQELKKAEGESIQVEVERDRFDEILRASSIGPEDERLCRGQAGVDLWQAFDNPTDVTNCSVIYWMARRKNGEKGLPFAKAAFRDLADLNEAGLALTYHSPGDEDDEDEGGADPTQSGQPSETTGPPSPSSTASTPETSAEIPN